MSQRLGFGTVLCGSMLLLAVAFATGAISGAYAISLSQLWNVLASVGQGSAGNPSPEHLVFLNIRLPRLILGMAAGAGLGMAGTLMQGLFRNPLADPGLIGISSGA